MSVLLKNIPPGLVALYTSMQLIITDPSTGVNKPEAVVRIAVLDMIKQFIRLTGRHPRLLYIPRSVEAALQIDRGRNLGFPEKTHGKIRGLALVFSCTPVWDADELKVE